MEQRRFTLAISLALLVSSCDDAGTGPDPAPPPSPFEPISAHAATAKVKDLLVGEAPTDAELSQVQSDPLSIRQLIDGWMTRDAFRVKMLDFFKQAFQQTQTGPNDYDEQLGRTTNPWNPVDKARFIRSAEESLARTAWQLVSEGRPFTETVETTRFMLNPPLLSSLAFMDAVPLADTGMPEANQVWIPRQFPGFRFIRETLEGPIPLSETLDPRHANFMKWYDPQPARGGNAQCTQDPFMVQGARALIFVGDFLYGGRPGCGPTVSQFTDQDWNSWKMVTVRAPQAGEQRTLFYDLPTLRGTTELVAATPRVGFLTTPAFFANWPTNTSNLARATMNQTLIVALGRSFDDGGITVTVNEGTDDDAKHASSAVCLGCHSTLDPMRDFFRQTFSVTYHMQYNPVESQKPGTFDLDGVRQQGKGVADLARFLAAHPRFARAWTQKLCRFANSTSCVEDDPEFLRVVGVFQDSGFDFRALVRELFSSPLVTLAAETKTTQEIGSTISIARREHLCTALQNRLGLPDVCALAAVAQRMVPVAQRTARNLALSVPGSGYSRGNEVPLLPHDPSLFFVSATENLCGLVASLVIDAGVSSRYQSAKADEAIPDFARTVMALPAVDPLAAPMTQVLRDHFAAAKAAGETPADALKSTFVLACASPLSLSRGL